MEACEMSETVSSGEAAPVTARAMARKRNINMSIYSKMDDFDDIVAEVKKSKKRKRLGTLIGQVSSSLVRSGTLPNGQPKANILLAGDFEGSNEITGELFRSNGVYLPDYYAALLQAKIESEDVISILIALEIGIEATTSAGSAIPYQWYCDELIEVPAESDPLTKLRNAVAASGKGGLLCPPIVGAAAMAAEKALPGPQKAAPR